MPNKKLINKIICGDCLEVMKDIEDNSIDTIITDPPYGLKFMGKKWDYDVPSIEIWKECLRVLKPGGTALIFAGSRTQHRMAVNVEDAGFILKDCIMWLYGSGFPKATDISKQLDKKIGKKRKIIKETKSGGYKRLMKTNKDQGFRPEDYYPEGNKFVSNEAISKKAKIWNGWKSHGLKPAYEPIIVAMKLNDGSYANNALKWGVSGLNIDGGRIPCNDPQLAEKYDSVKNASSRKNKVYGKDNRKRSEGNIKPNSQGRFPANVILDKKAGKMLDEQSGELKSGKMNSITKGHDPETFNTYSKQYVRKVEAKGGKGGASRFFYCAKASKAERNMGCGQLEEKLGGSLEGGNDTRNRKNKPQLRPTKNYHPTVKPLKLMEYLCTLTKTPTGGLVLDPFAGSGTTGIACKNTGRDFILIELDKDYCKIACKRIGLNKILRKRNDRP